MVPIVLWPSKPKVVGSIPTADTIFFLTFWIFQYNVSTFDAE